MNKYINESTKEFILKVLVIVSVIIATTAATATVYKILHDKFTSVEEFYEINLTNLKQNITKNATKSTN